MGNLELHNSDEQRDEGDGYFGGRRMARLPLKRKAVVYLRQSSYEQMKKRRHSLEMQTDLRRIASEEFGYTPDQVLFIDSDLGISGTLTEEDRAGLAEVLRLIRQEEVEAVFVVKPDRLYRDQTLVGPIDFALDCQKHDVYVIFTGYFGPTIIDFNNDEDFENWVKMCQESAKELKNMQVRLGGARFYKAKSGKYSGGPIHWGWRYDPKEDCKVPYPPHRQTVLNIFRTAAECTSLRQILLRVKQDPACWFEPFRDEDRVMTRPRHLACLSRLSPDQPYIPNSIYRIQSILTHAGYIGVRLYGSGPGAQRKINAKARKQKRGKVRTRLRVRPHFFGVYPEEALLQTPEEQALFWEIQERFNPIDLKRCVETSFKQLYRNPTYKWAERGRPRDQVRNPYARLVFCGQHGFDEAGDFILTHSMRAWVNGVWGCRRDWDQASSKVTCTNVRRRILERLMDTHVRLRLSGGQNHLNDLVQLIEQHQEKEDAQQAMLRQKLDNIQQAVANYTAQLKDIDMKTEVGRFLFVELQGRLSPLLSEKQLLESRLAREKGLIRRGVSEQEIVSVREALKRISVSWDQIEPPVRNALLTLVLENIVVYAVPGKRTLIVRFRWRDGHDDWCLGWYWGERNAEPWAEWEDEALRRLWENEKSARKILAALKPGRKWRTVRPHARQLGLDASVKRPDVAEILLEQDKEKVPTDESETLVYYFLGRTPRGELPEVDQVQEVHEKDGEIWLGPTVTDKISVSILLSPSAKFVAPTVTSTRMLAWTI